MKRFLFLSSLIAVAAIASADVTGKWVGTMKGPGVMPAGAKVGSVSTPKYTLTLNKNGSYTMETKSGTRTINTDGKWKQTGSELTLTPSEAAKKQGPMIQERKVKIGAGEKTLVMEIKVKMMASTMASGGSEKLDVNDKAKMAKMMKDAKDMTLSVEFKRG